MTLAHTVLEHNTKHTCSYSTKPAQAQLSIMMIMMMALMTMMMMSVLVMMTTMVFSCASSSPWSRANNWPPGALKHPVPERLTRHSPRAPRSARPRGASDCDVVTTRCTNFATYRAICSHPARPPRCMRRGKHPWSRGGFACPRPPEPPPDRTAAS